VSVDLPLPNSDLPVSNARDRALPFPAGLSILAIGKEVVKDLLPRHVSRPLNRRTHGVSIPTKRGNTVSDRPDFNEYPIWSPNNSPRNGKKVDLFLLHTNEADTNADQLARWMSNSSAAVSYHYCVSEDYNDHGVTVVDVVDTDDYSWSVLSANSRSINLCFAGSRAAWTRDQWLKQSRAIDVAAYIAVQDCKKYGISLNVVAPPYATTPGISDHQYVTKVLKDGTHTDVGPGFPWDVFASAVAKYANPSTPVTPPPPPAPAPKSDRQLLQEIWDQLRIAWPQLGGKTLVDAVAELLKDKA
jgi:N-acetyl-anhydromuramyl-L-alanine amidase AmpD